MAAATDPAQPADWSANQAPGAPTNLSSHFPRLQLTEDDIRSGAVRVVARSPSGQTRVMDVHIDPNGQFMSDFTPNEIGKVENRPRICTRESYFQGPT